MMLKAERHGSVLTTAVEVPVGTATRMRSVRPDTCTVDCSWA